MLKENINAIKWLTSVSAGNRIFLTISVCAAILGGCVSIVPFILFYELIQRTMHGTAHIETVGSICLASFVAILLKYVLLFGATMCSHRAAFDIQCTLRKNLLDHVGNLPLGFFNKNSSGLLRKITSEDIENLEIYIAHHIPDTAMSITVPLVIVGIISYQNPLLPLVLILPLILMFIALSKTSKIRKVHVKEYFDNMENMNSATIEYIKAIPIIKIFNITVESFSKFHNAIQKQIEITSEWIKKSSPFFVMFKSSLDFILPSLMFVISLGVYKGWNVEVSTYILCFVLAAAMVKPINQIHTSSNLLCSLMEGARRVEQIMSLPPIPDTTEPEKKPSEDFNVTFYDISFSYEKKQVLHDINMRFDKSGLYALVGESGSGKTTTAQLLLRFWDIQQGGISIGDVDIRKLPLDFLLKNIAFAFQDSFILDGTIRENLCMEKNNISDEDMIKAAKIVEAHTFITTLPSGYDTVIGAEGSRLSGGEKQRVCLARAILKKSPILVLDEPTSQVDATIERKIFKSIKEQCQDQIVLFITHRIATAVNADAVFVFDKGEIVASGPHETLLTECATYRTMWNLANKANNWALQTRS